MQNYEEQNLSIEIEDQQSQLKTVAFRVKM